MLNPTLIPNPLYALRMSAGGASPPPPPPPPAPVAAFTLATDSTPNILDMDGSASTGADLAYAWTSDAGVIANPTAAITNANFAAAMTGVAGVTLAVTNGNGTANVTHGAYWDGSSVQPVPFLLGLSLGGTGTGTLALAVGTLVYLGADGSAAMDYLIDGAVVASATPSSGGGDSQNIDVSGYADGQHQVLFRLTQANGDECDSGPTSPDWRFYTAGGVITNGPPPVVSSNVLWLEPGSISGVPSQYQTAGTGTPATANGDPVHDWVDQVNGATLAVAGTTATVVIDGDRWTQFGSGVEFDLPSPITLPVASGWTFYTCLDFTSTALCCPLGGSSAYLIWHPTGVVIFSPNGIAAAQGGVAIVSGKSIARVRYDGAGNYYLRQGSGAEQSIPTHGTMVDGVIDKIGSSSGGAIQTNSAVYIGPVVINAADTLTDSPSENAAILSYLIAEYPDAANWGTSG